MVFELAKQLRISTICQWRLCQLITPRAGESWQNLPLADSALCQLTQRMVFELAKQLWISTVVSGGFANSSHRVLERVGKTYPCLTVRFANSLAGWCLSWQSNYGSALFVSGGFANSSHRVLERVGKTYPWLTVRFANSLRGWCLSWQSNCGSAPWSVAALPTHHTACWRELAKPTLA